MCARLCVSPLLELGPRRPSGIRNHMTDAINTGAQKYFSLISIYCTNSTETENISHLYKLLKHDTASLFHLTNLWLVQRLSMHITLLNGYLSRHSTGPNHHDTYTIPSIYIHNIHAKEVKCLFYRWGKWGRERLSNLFQGTWEASGRAMNWTDNSSIPVQCLNHKHILPLWN